MRKDLEIAGLIGIVGHTTIGRQIFSIKKTRFVIFATYFSRQLLNNHSQRQSPDNTVLEGKTMMIERKQLYLFGWLAAATVMLSLVGLTAEPSQQGIMVVAELPTY